MRKYKLLFFKKSKKKFVELEIFSNKKYFMNKYN